MSAETNPLPSNLDAFERLADGRLALSEETVVDLACVEAITTLIPGKLYDVNATSQLPMRVQMSPRLMCLCKATQEQFAVCAHVAYVLLRHRPELLASVAEHCPAKRACFVRRRTCRACKGCP